MVIMRMANPALPYVTFSAGWWIYSTE